MTAADIRSRRVRPEMSEEEYWALIQDFAARYNSRRYKVSGMVLRKTESLFSRTVTS